MISVKGKWVPIIGASCGIGRLIALFMSKQGCNLVLLGGVKQSGLGRKGGPEAILAYARLKNIWLKIDSKK